MAAISNPGNVVQDVGIAVSQTKSDVIDLRGSTITGFQVPVALDGASVTFEGSLDGTAWYPIRSSAGTALSVTLNGTGIYKLNPVDFLGIAQLKLVAAAVQTVARVITVTSGDYTEN